MKLETKYHGVLNYEEEEIITFPNGMLGFENLNKFIMFSAEENPMFTILHSLDDKDIGFLVISPFEVMENYEVKLSDNIIQQLNITEEKDVILLNTVTLNTKVENITVNLRAPIVINIKQKLGEQIIVDNEEYLIKYPLIKG
ncbi:flagellar assembly protein FliW [Desnuesiella massiliensis]|uniref:flagellar assembly protein FliW n=1 Tax=Desnuesiella massiliensis TaxID=1650662 RepID=UPI0006E241B6|nr:flagellar assembly protein FliW [Desnuesiella massiliensis]